VKWLLHFLYDKIEPTAVCIPLTTGTACLISHYQSEGEVVQGNVYKI